MKSLIVFHLVFAAILVAITGLTCLLLGLEEHFPSAAVSVLFGVAGAAVISSLRVALRESDLRTAQENARHELAITEINARHESAVTLLNKDHEVAMKGISDEFVRRREEHLVKLRAAIDEFQASLGVRDEPRVKEA